MAMKRVIGFSVAAVAAAVAVVFGCRNLDLPADNTGANPGPTLRFVSPVTADDAGIPEVSLTSFVSVDAQDADGVGEVDLSCTVNGGQVALVRWVSAPYEGLVDLSPCRGNGAADGGSGDITLVLTATGTDALGNQSAQQETVQVRVNVQQAVLAVVVPASIRPGTPFDITVTSDRALIAPPDVKVGGVPADFVVDQTPDGGTPVFLFHTAQAPQLGAAAYTGTGPAPFELLEQDQQLVTVAVDGRALNGNDTQVQAQVSVSRVLWSRSLPTRLSVGALDGPVTSHAVDGGLYVPLSSRPAQPVFFRASDGEPLLYPSDLEAAYAFLGPLNSGEGVFESESPIAVQLQADGTLALGQSRAPTSTTGSLDSAGIPLLPDGGSISFGGGTAASLDFTAVTQPGGSGLLRPSVVLNGEGGDSWAVGGYVCQDATTDLACAATTPRGLNCVGAGVDVKIDGGTDAYSAGTPAPVVVVSGSTVALLNAGTSCLNTRVSNNLKLAPLTSPGSGFVNYPGQTFTRVLPEGNGAFMGVYSTSVNGVALSQLIEFDLTSPALVGPLSFPQANRLAISASELLAARPDHGIVFLQASGAAVSTLFGVWYPGSAAAPTTSSSLPLIYSAPFTVTPVLPALAEVDADGSVYLLLHRSAAAAGVPRTDIVALDGSLQPRWIYHYPRADLGVDNSFRITLDRVSGQLYLVDGDNGFVTALAR